MWIENIHVYKNRCWLKKYAVSIYWRMLPKSHSQPRGIFIPTLWYLYMLLKNIFFMLWKQTQKVIGYRNLSRKEGWKVSSSRQGDSKVLEESN